MAVCQCFSVWYEADYLQKSLREKKRQMERERNRISGDEKKQKKLIRAARCLTGNFNIVALLQNLVSSTAIY